MKIENATIDSTFLGIQEHGRLTFTLFLRFGGAVQGFGNLALDRWDAEASVHVGLAFAAGAIRAILETVGVEKWEDLVGKHVRTEGNHAHLVRIGHIVEDRWVDLSLLSCQYAEMERTNEWPSEGVSYGR